MNEQRIVEVVYIRNSPERVWDALTNPDVTARYWGMGTRIESDWRVGSTIRYVRDGEVTDAHEILAVDPPRMLRHTFRPLFGEFASEPPSRVAFTIERSGDVVRLSIVHDDFPPRSRVYRACRDGWPMIASNLKTLLETGEPLPTFSFAPSDGSVDATDAPPSQIETLEQRLLQPSVRRSAQEVERLLAAEFVEIAIDGRAYDKAQVVAALESESPRERSMDAFRLTMLADDVALATYRSTRRHPASGASVASLRSSIWRLRDGRWQIAFHQGTPCADD